MTSLPNEFIDAQVQFGPNPVNSDQEFSINTGNLTIENYVMTDLNGKKVNIRGDLEVNRLRVFLNDLNAGLYLIKLNGRDWQKTVKVLLTDQ